MSIRTPEEVLEDLEIHLAERVVHIVNPPMNHHIMEAVGRFDLDAADIVAVARQYNLPVVALCGKTFIPTQDPESIRDTCEHCLKVAAEIMKELGE